MQNPLARRTVSVVIPAYNAEAHIAKAVDSVLSQTCPVDQVIVVDDGSVDATAEILAAYGDRIEVLSIPNGGVSNARNTGLRQARGELIALLDADDQWSDSKIERQLQVLADHPGVEFTCCNYLVQNLQTGVAHASFDRLQAGRAPFADRVLRRPVDELLAENLIGTCSNVMFTRVLLDRVGLFDTELRQAEDFDLWLRMALETDFYLQSEPLLKKVEHGGNLTGRWDETLRFHELVVTRFRERHAMLFAADSALDRIYRTGLADTRYELAGVLFAKGRRKEGFRTLASAWGPERSTRNAMRLLKRALRRLLLPAQGASPTPPVSAGPSQPA